MEENSAGNSEKPTNISPKTSKNPPREKFKRLRPSMIGRAIKVSPEKKSVEFSKTLSPTTKNIAKTNLTKIAPDVKQVTKNSDITTTPNGSKVKRITTIGFLDLYGDVNASPKISAPRIPTDISKLPSAPITAIKKMYFSFSKNNLEMVKREKQKNNNRRIPNQKEVMGISANEAAELYGYEANDADNYWEWLHLISYEIMGGSGQIIENLILDPDEPNSQMMFAEREMIKRVSSFSNQDQKLELTVYALIFPGSLVGQLIFYHMKCDLFNIVISFDLLTRYKPHRNLTDYYQILFTTAIERKKLIACIDTENNIAIINKLLVHLSTLDPKNIPAAEKANIISFFTDLQNWMPDRKETMAAIVKNLQAAFADTNKKIVLPEITSEESSANIEEAKIGIVEPKQLQFFNKPPNKQPTNRKLLFPTDVPKESTSDNKQEQESSSSQFSIPTNS